MTYLIVFIGGGIGSALRHGVNLAAARFLGIGFPSGTLLVNVIGSLAMGLIAGYFAFRGDASQHWRLFLTTGILGGFMQAGYISKAGRRLYIEDVGGLMGLMP